MTATRRTTDPRFLLSVLLVAGIALVGWQARPTTGRTALQAGLVSLEEASAFTGTDIDRSRAHGSEYSFAQYVGRDDQTQLIIEVVYDDYPLPSTVPSASDGNAATLLVEADGDTGPVPGGSADDSLLDFTVDCVPVRVSAIGFDPTDEETADFRALLTERARKAAQGEPASC